MYKRLKKLSYADRIKQLTSNPHICIVCGKKYGNVDYTERIYTCCNCLAKIRVSLEALDRLGVISDDYIINFIAEKTKNCL